MKDAYSFEIDVEGIGVLHQEFAPAHKAEAGPDLVAELPVDLVEVLGQVAVAFEVGAEDVGDDLLVGGAVEHVALVPVLDAQHLGAVVVVPAAFPPQVGRLDGRHDDLLGAGGVLLLAHDARDVGEHACSKRQPVVDARGVLADHAGAQHQAVGDDLGLGGVFLEGRGEKTRQTHAQSWEAGRWNEAPGP
jgi:hypothetical protein